MSTEQLTGLQLAVKLLAQIGNDDSDRAIAAVHDLAEAHTQRLTLQHHAADQVWRIADLEVKCVTLKELHDAATDERDALRVKVSDLERAAVKRREISDGVEAELVDECDTLRTLKSKTESERDALRARLAEIEAQEQVAPTVVPDKPSQTFRMSMAQRILHVGGRNNSAGYVEFGGVQAVEALVRQALRDAKLNYARAATAQAVPDADAAIDAAMAAAPEHKA